MNELDVLINFEDSVFGKQYKIITWLSMISNVSLEFLPKLHVLFYYMLENQNNHNGKPEYHHSNISTRQDRLQNEGQKTQHVRWRFWTRPAVCPDCGPYSNLLLPAAITIVNLFLKIYFNFIVKLSLGLKNKKN